MNRLTDGSRQLHRTIPAAFALLGVVQAEAFMAQSSEGYQLSVDQATLTTAESSFKRRLIQPASVHSITVADVTDAGMQIGSDIPVIDDHDPSDPMRCAHASVDFTTAQEKPRRRAAAAFLAERCTQSYP